MKDIDEEISKVISAKIYEPEGYKNAIETALYKENIKSPKTYFYKMIAIVCSCLILLSGVAYAIIKNVFNNRKGVETAINNNYIMEGLEEYQESNGIAVKINNILMDDYNLDISFNIKSDEEIKVERTRLIRFEKMVIIDEENRILFHTDGKEVLEEFIEKNKLNVKIDDFNEKYVNTGVNAKVRNKTANQFDLVYNIATYENSTPKSKEIIIYAENVMLNKETIIEGTWQIKHKMSNQFYNREKIIYHFEDIIDEDIINIGAETYATGTNLSIEMKDKFEKTDKNDLEMLLNEIEIQTNNKAGNENNLNELREKLINENNQLYGEFNNIYIENLNGTKFYVTNNINDSNKILASENQSTTSYSNILDMTIYDCTKEITVHFTYNEKDYNIKLSCI